MAGRRVPAERWDMKIRTLPKADRWTLQEDTSPSRTTAWPVPIGTRHAGRSDHPAKVWRLGDWIARAYDAYGERHAPMIARLAFNARLVMFCERRKLLKRPAENRLL
jgi:hypothetical protein